MDYVVITAASLLAAGLTLFSGFGLGTLLMPVFAVFFPLQAAIAMTAVVHLANNIFATILLRRDADWRIVCKFSLVAGPAALLGAVALSWMGRVPVLHQYVLAGRECTITTLKLVLAVVVGAFAVLELAGVISDKLNRDAAIESGSAAPGRLTGWLALGAALSGFFGGLSGHQGAIRSAFLVRAGLSKESFIATGKISAMTIDVIRLAAYAGAAGFGLSAGGGSLADLAQHAATVRGEAEKGGAGAWGLVAAGCLAAFVGSFLGTRLVQKVTMRQVRVVVGVGLVLFSAAMGAGLL